MYRHQESYLESWLNKKERKPLIIRGARQVGKSTLVRNFAKDKNLHLVEINLEKFLHWNDLFKQQNPRLILEKIEDLLNQKINFKEQILLFFDEIQATPFAISCLRYFYEEFPFIPVIAAGSLLEFTLNDHEYNMPVGRIEFMHLGPMTFYEFLLAKNENYLLTKLKSIKDPGSITYELHQKAMNLLKEYFFVGGMPEAIKVFLESGTDAISQIHEQILETYQNDFVKYSKKKHLMQIQKIFRYLYLNPCSKIKYSNISSDELSRDLKLNLELLFKARVATPVYHSTCSGIPLEVTKNEKVFKTLVLDIGLMNHMQKVSWISIKNENEISLLTEGVMAEQFIGQHLLSLSAGYELPQIYYWLREGKSTNAEVDFILESSPELIAIEVKVGKVGKIRSLHQWMKDISYKKKRAIRFNLSIGAMEKVSYQFEDQLLQYDLLTLPLYLIESLNELKNNFIKT